MMLCESLFLRSQRGGAAVGFLIGLLVGVVSAVFVFLLVTHVQVPFINKSLSAQDLLALSSRRPVDPNRLFHVGGALAKGPTKEGVDDAQLTPTPPAFSDGAEGAAKKQQSFLQEDGGSSSKSLVSSEGPTAVKHNGSGERQGSLLSGPRALLVSASRELKDAADMKARLALLGVQAIIRQIEEPSGVLYRVVVMADSEEESVLLQESLAEEGIRISPE